ncbi:MAG TPA: enolase C-terminal domain-like protein [Bryobacteraceae bacterium]|nr:enolase C-terminal domain-like protein [Bryobacteraceae bacterium]
MRHVMDSGRSPTRRHLLVGSSFLPFSGLALQAAREQQPVIRKVEVIPIKLPYNRPFVLGLGLVGNQNAAGTYVFVRIEASSGHVGWGETIALPKWSYETAESICSTVRDYLAPIVMGRSPFDQAWFEEKFEQTLTPAISNGFPFAKGAVLLATLDLAGQIAGVPLHRLFRGKLRDTVELTFALSLDTPGGMARAAQEGSYLKCFKVKVGGDSELDAARVRAIAKARPDAKLWIDANQSYRPIHLEDFVKRIEDIRQVQCLEQPVPSTDWLGLRRAREKVRIPIAADEGCFTSRDVARLAQLEAVDLIVLKLAKSSGPWGCFRSATVADAHGLGLIGSGLTESGVGLTASVHFFSTLDLLLPPELNGPHYLSDLFVEGLQVNNNIVTVPDAPGLGVQVKEADLRKHAFNV